jgi:diguanylate cyclase (GGDEF)-like protein
MSVRRVPAPQATAPISAQRANVLLVDDQPENLVALEAALESVDARLVCVQSGVEALRAVLDEQFAVILLDVRMPVLDGFETMKLLKQRERTRNVPIIFLSAAQEERNVWRGYASGAVDYLHKPVDPEALRAKVSVFIALHEKELALQRAHAELEQRVLERTAELAASNEALEHEIAERRAAEHRLYELAHRDALTGFANRGMLMEEIDRALARTRRGAPPFAVMMIDVDRFKGVNDRLGHLAGDRLLLGLANRLASCLRSVDIAGRLGGDEFAILLDGVAAAEDATKTAARIQRALEVPFMFDGKEVSITASIGIAVMEPRYTKGEELLRDADAAMYRAKETGRARYQVFDLEMRTTATAQMRVEGELARAVGRAELLLHYQPIVDVRTTAPVGFEALVRWQHPERGLVHPADFIPLAESNGMIRAIGHWVLEEACRQLAAWHTHPALTMSVNLSTHQLADPDLARMIEDVIRGAQIDPRRLNLEITDSAVMPNIGLVEETLAKLRHLGVAVSLDDFGTGYSCLSYLHELPVTAVKVDRSFVQRLYTPKERPELVHAIVALAHTLGISVTAEGVETAQQLAFLRELACEHAQGFLFSEPLDAGAAIRFLTSA